MVYVFPDPGPEFKIMWEFNGELIIQSGSVISIYFFPYSTVSVAERSVGFTYSLRFSSTFLVFLSLSKTTVSS